MVQVLVICCRRGSPLTSTKHLQQEVCLLFQMWAIVKLHVDGIPFVFANTKTWGWGGQQLPNEQSQTRYIYGLYSTRAKFMDEIWVKEVRVFHVNTSDALGLYCSVIQKISSAQSCRLGGKKTFSDRLDPTSIKSLSNHAGQKTIQVV